MTSEISSKGTANQRRSIVELVPFYFFSNSDRNRNKLIMGRNSLRTGIIFNSALTEVNSIGQLHHVVHIVVIYGPVDDLLNETMLQCIERLAWSSHPIGAGESFLYGSFIVLISLSTVRDRSGYRGHHPAK